MHPNTTFDCTARAEALARSLGMSKATLLRAAREDMRARGTLTGVSLVFHVLTVDGHPFSCVPERGRIVVDLADWASLSRLDEPGRARG